MARVFIVNYNFYNRAGTVLYKGGAERYVLDLARLIGELGHEATLLQVSEAAFEKCHDGIRVEGLPLSSTADAAEVSAMYARRCAEADLVICSPLELACKMRMNCPVIGINHGVHWDNITNRLGNFTHARHRAVVEALQRVDSCVCVDTNFINWVRTLSSPMAQRCEYVPNYFDPDQFGPVAKDFHAEKVTVLCARRLYGARGLYLTLEAFERLLPEFPALHLALVGQAVDADAEAVRGMIGRFPGRVSWREYAPEEMHQAYSLGQVSLIPTLCSEGTSLSCLESMATGHAVIATHVGGLPNLILPDFNGVLIPPTVDALVSAVRELIRDRNRMAALAGHAVLSAKAFAKPRWDLAWRRTLHSFLD